MSSSIRQGLFFVVLLGLPVASYFVVFRPVNAKIEEGMKEIEHKQARLDKLREVTAQTDDLQRDNEKIAEAIRTIQGRLPSTKEMDNVLRQVSGLAGKNGLRVPQFKKSDQTMPAGDAMEQPLDIEITGDFDGFYNFLLDLEQLPRITRITDMSITRSDKVDGEMKTRFTLSVFYEGEGSAQ
jgi:type IV pilus assembly protein PilO